MNAIDRLIFNRLAQRKPVGFPGVGTLRVVFRGAGTAGRKRLAAPVNEVVFSEREAAGDACLTDLIAHASDTDPATAQTYYDRWLSQAQRGGTLTIEGVGELKWGVFFPSPELAGVLNPVRPALIRLRRRKNPSRLLLILLLAAAACSGLFFALKSGALNELPEMTGLRNIFPHQPVSEMQDPPPVVRPNAPETTPSEQPNTPASVEPAPETSPDAADRPSGKPLYHLVAGVFSLDENADRFIAAETQKQSGFTYRKVPMRNGKIVVSLFASDDRDKTERRRAELAAGHPDLWIYREPS